MADEPDNQVKDDETLEAFEWAMRIIAYRTIEEAGGAVTLSIADIAAFDGNTNIRMRLNGNNDIVLEHIHVTAVDDDNPTN